MSIQCPREKNGTTEVCFSIAYEPVKSHVTEAALRKATTIERDTRRSYGKDRKTFSLEKL